jgi:hypothetical protein
MFSGKSVYGTEESNKLAKTDKLLYRIMRTKYRALNGIAE